MDRPLHLFDCVSYPQVTWAKKKDDCDGFSVLRLLELLTASEQHVILVSIIPMANSSLQIINYLGRGEYA